MLFSLFCGSYTLFHFEELKSGNLLAILSCIPWLVSLLWAFSLTLVSKQPETHSKTAETNAHTGQIDIYCPFCNQKLGMSREKFYASLGKRTKCPTCHKLMTLSIDLLSK